MDIIKFIKFMNLTTSSNDGETLNSIRKANELLKENNMTWTEFINGRFIIIKKEEFTYKKEPNIINNNFSIFRLLGNIYGRIIH